MELLDEALHIRRGDVELQVAQRLHLLRRRAQLHEALGIVLRLRGHAGDVRSARRINAASSR
jgi:hypothetical protein